MKQNSPVIYCEKCQKKITNSKSIKCPNCGNIFHNHVDCLKTEQKSLRHATKCPACGEETYSFNERNCPTCGQYLFSYHFGCEKNFDKNVH